MLNSDILIKLVIFQIRENQLSVLLQEGHVPHNPLVTNMSLDAIAKDLFTICTGLPMGDNYIEQLYTFSAQKEVSIGYFVLLAEKDIVLPEGFSWENASNISAQTADGDIIGYARKRLAWKVEYTNVVYSLLPKTFTLRQLQEVYETILGHKVDKRNFRKKIMSLKFIEPTGEKHIAHARPAQLYRFISRKPTIVKVFS